MPSKKKCFWSLFKYTFLTKFCFLFLQAFCAHPEAYGQALQPVHAICCNLAARIAHTGHHRLQPLRICVKYIYKYDIIIIYINC
jgi:hypothetical protein